MGTNKNVVRDGFLLKADPLERECTVCSNADKVEPHEQLLRQRSSTQIPTPTLTTTAGIKKLRYDISFYVCACKRACMPAYVRASIAKNSPVREFGFSSSSSFFRSERRQRRICTFWLLIDFALEFVRLKISIFS